MSILCPRHIGVKIQKLLPDIGDDIPQGRKDILGVPIGEKDDSEIEQSRRPDIQIRIEQGVITDVCLVAACLSPETECMEADGDANENIIIHQHVWHQHHTDSE